MSLSERPHVVIIGGGFAGLNATRALRKADVSITLIDQRNHHVFQPLLYQVATASLSPADIAAPIRAIVRKQENVRVILAEVTGADLEKRVVALDNGQLSFDYLILAAGSTHSYFGHDEWQPNARGLKSLDDAVAIRNQILTGFEAAERADSEAERLRHLNFVVIGGGPTGVELAGAIAEIARHSLARDFDTIDPTQASIHLIEASPRILAAFPERLAARAQADLARLGVDVRPGLMVTGIDEQGVFMANGERIEAATKLWAAGVQASPLGRQLGVEVDRAGRIVVGPDLTIAEHPHVFVAGDLAALNGTDGRQLPGVAQVAIQQGKAAAANIERSTAGKVRVSFVYRDRGNMATIGRNHAIAVIGPLKLTGFLAWLAWVLIHIVNLIGFRNRLLVMSQWIWGYVTFHRRVRLITGR